MDKSSVIAEFDGKAEIYDDGPHGEMYHAHNDFILERLTLQPGETLLDVGCAGGYLIEEALKAAPGARGIGVEIAPKMATVAAQRFQPSDGSVQVFHCDWERPTSELSAALAETPPAHAVFASVYHYFEDPDAAMAQAHAALAPGGVLWLLERRKDGSPLNMAWDLLHKHVVRDHVRFYYNREMIETLRSAGFVEAEVALTIDRFLWKNKLFTNLSLIKAVKAGGGRNMNEMGVPEHVDV